MTAGKILSRAALVLAVSAFALPSSAATVTYCGPNVCYEYDNAQAAAAMFGLPTFIGDSLLFTPTVFEARSQDGIGIHAPFGNTDVADATFIFSRVYTVSASNEIASLSFQESGDYEINYAAGEVHADLYVQAVGLNAIPFEFLVATDSFDQVGPPFGLQLWDMDAMLTPAASFTQLANNMRLTIQNTLSAFTSNTTPGSELAWIEKKLVLTVATTTPVVIPVPAAIWLFGSAFGLLALVRRRSA